MLKEKRDIHFTRIGVAEGEREWERERDVVDVVDLVNWSYSPLSINVWWSTHGRSTSHLYGFYL
jgi:hypothetical protein